MLDSRRHSLLLPLALLLAAFSPSPDGSEKLVLDAGGHSVLDLMHKSADFLGRTYLVDQTQAPDIAKATTPHMVQLRRRLELDRQGCEEVLGQILFSKGWVAVPLDAERGIYDWIWTQGPKAGDIKKRVVYVDAGEIRRKPKLPRYVTTSMRLEYTNAQSASMNLRVFFTDPRGMTMMIPVGTQDQRTIVLTGWQPEVSAQLQLLERIDVPPQKVPPTLDERLQSIEKRLAKLEARRQRKL